MFVMELGDYKSFRCVFICRVFINSTNLYGNMTKKVERVITRVDYRDRIFRMLPIHQYSPYGKSDY